MASFVRLLRTNGGGVETGFTKLMPVGAPGELSSCRQHGKKKEVVPRFVSACTVLRSHACLPPPFRSHGLTISSPCTAFDLGRGVSWTPVDVIILGCWTHIRMVFEHKTVSKHQVCFQTVMQTPKMRLSTLCDLLQIY